MTEEELEFLKHSNWIEREYSDIAMEDAIKAWNFAKRYKHCITLSFIKTIHQELMLRLNFRIAGNYRRCLVYVGYEECLKPSRIIKALENWLRTHRDAKTVDEIKKAHIRFEKIHPFEDGNGRTGRILMNIQRLNANLPLMIIHEGDEQMEYYKWFK